MRYQNLNICISQVLHYAIWECSVPLVLFDPALPWPDVFQGFAPPAWPVGLLDTISSLFHIYQGLQDCCDCFVSVLALLRQFHVISEAPIRNMDTWNFDTKNISPPSKKLNQTFRNHRFVLILYLHASQDAKITFILFSCAQVIIFSRTCHFLSLLIM